MDKETEQFSASLGHRSLTKHFSPTAEAPVQLCNPSARTPAIQAAYWGHGRAEASWSNSLLPPAVTLHYLPTDTLFLPATAEEEAAHGISDCKDTSPSPHCSIAASPPLPPCMGPKPGHRQEQPWTPAGKEREQRFAAGPQQQNPLDLCPSNTLPGSTTQGQLRADFRWYKTSSFRGWAGRCLHKLLHRQEETALHSTHAGAPNCPAGLTISGQD